MRQEKLGKRTWGICPLCGRYTPGWKVIEIDEHGKKHKKFKSDLLAHKCPVAIKRYAEAIKELAEKMEPGIKNPKLLKEE